MKTSLKPLYTIQSLNAFAGSLVGIFIPIYLLTIGYPIRQVMIFIFLQAIFGFGFALITGFLSAKIPLRWIMVVSVPVLILVLALLVSDKSHQVPLALIAALYGAQFALYWIPLHIYLILGTSTRTIGKQLGLFFALPQAASIFGPLLSGIAIDKFGFDIVFVLAAFVYTTSALPMIWVPAYKEPLDFGLSKFLSLYSKFKTYFWLEVIENIQEEFDGVIWPLAVFIVLGSTIQAGLAGTLIAAGSSVFTFFLGKATDQKPGFPFLRVGAIIMLLLWVWRLQHLTLVTVIVISSIAGIATMLKAIPFNGLIYNLARENNPREFILFRETPVFLARAIVYALGAIVAIHFRQLFWLAIVAYAAFALIPMPTPKSQRAAS